MGGNEATAQTLSASDVSDIGATITGTRRKDATAVKPTRILVAGYILQALL